MLWNRNVHKQETAQQFIHPKLSSLHDPRLMPGIERAATRMVQAARDGQPIVIYGDYDVDGITASSVLWHMLSSVGANVTTYVPHRIEEGYGLNTEAILQLSEKENPLIISVDCGITAFEPARAAKDAGIDLIITDHHEFHADNLPDAYALVHPRLEGDYPFDGLCGAGVAMKLAWQFAREFHGSERLPVEARDLMLDLLSLVALGTVADVVPLVDENRIITWFGLGQIKRTRFAGLNALIDVSKLRDNKISAFHIGFALGPRLNACGRMGHAKDAVHMLTTASPDEAKQIANFLNSENDKRRATEREITAEAKKMIVDNGFDSPDTRAIVVGKKDWHPGVVGIVASRLVDTFARPSIVLNFDENDEAHGSARSVEGVSIHVALDQCGRFLKTYGGHAMAAGLRLDVDQVDAFREALIEYVNTQIGPNDLATVIDIDGECRLSDVDMQLVEQLQKLEPFGRANPTPALCLRDAKIDQPPLRAGGNGMHLRLSVRQDGKVMRTIGFGLGDLVDELHAGMHVDIAFEPKLSLWQGRRNVEIHVKDVCPV